jgi:hypothetical protein
MSAVSGCYLNFIMVAYLLPDRFLIMDNNGGKQADVVDTTERFCTKMCIFSACSALKLSTNVIE